MHCHHFALGQVVRLLARDGTASDRAGKYKVTRLLPTDGAQLRYCLEHQEFHFWRLAWQSDLIGVILPGWRIKRPLNSPGIRLWTLTKRLWWIS